MEAFNGVRAHCTAALWQRRQAASIRPCAAVLGAQSASFVRPDRPRGNKGYRDSTETHHRTAAVTRPGTGLCEPSPAAMVSLVWAALCCARVRAVLPGPQNSLDPRRAVPLALLHRSPPSHPKVWTGRKELSPRLSRGERGGALSLSLSRAERDGSRGVAGGGCGLGAPRAARALGDATGLQAP